MPADRPDGPRRPPRPTPGPAGRAPSARRAEAPKAPTAPKAPAPPRPRTKAPIPSAPGPRPEPVARPPRTRRPERVATSGVTFREPPRRAAPAPTPAPRTPRPPRTSRRPPATTLEPSGPPSKRQQRVQLREEAAAAALGTPLGAGWSPFRQRYGVPYNTQGPRVRYGVLWALAVVVAMAPQSLRPFGLAVVYAVVAGAAAGQIVDAFRQDGGQGDRLVARLGASTLPVLATQGARALGVGLLGLVVVALVAAASGPDGDRPLVGRAGTIVSAAGTCGGAAASLVLLANYEIGAVIILLVLVMAYDASDFVVGSGATNGIEGPLAGALSIAAFTLIFGLLKVPPFRGGDVWSFAVLAMVACPLGQLLASALLPRADTPASGLRRLDTILVVAPAWAGLVGLYLQRAG